MAAIVWHFQIAHENSVGDGVLSEAAAEFGYSANIKFRIDNAFRDARLFSMGHLRKCMQILTETDVKMKSLKTDNMILLEEAVIQMLSSK